MEILSVLACCAENCHMLSTHTWRATNEFGRAVLTSVLHNDTRHVLHAECMSALLPIPHSPVLLRVPLLAVLSPAHGSWLAWPADSSVAINQQVKSNVQQLQKPAEPTVEILKFHHICNSSNNNSSHNSNNNNSNSKRNQNHPQKIELISMFNKKFMKICQPASFVLQLGPDLQGGHCTGEGGSRGGGYACY